MSHFRDYVSYSWIEYSLHITWIFKLNYLLNECDSIKVWVADRKVSRWFYRYHYNVADTRLRQHVDKGNEDGLYISCVASAANLWALIMDAGTGFSSQVYELSAAFLHKVSISITLHFHIQWLSLSLFFS